MSAIINNTNSTASTSFLWALAFCVYHSLPSIHASCAQLDKALEEYPWLTPVAIEMFVGKYDPAKLRFAHKLLAALPASPLHGMPASDHRNWEAIRAWASDLASKLS